MFSLAWRIWFNVDGVCVGRYSLLRYVHHGGVLSDMYVCMYVCMCMSAVARAVNSGTFVCVRCLDKVCCPVRQSGSRLTRREGIVHTVSDGVCFLVLPLM